MHVAHSTQAYNFMCVCEHAHLICVCVCVCVVCCVVCVCVVCVMCYVCVCCGICVCVHRNRTKLVYSLFSRKSPSAVHAILRGLGVDYVISEDSWCSRRSGPGTV